MESKSVDFASKSDKLSSLFSTTNSHLSEPISANTSKDVEELQKEIDDIEKVHLGDRNKDLTEITELEKSIKDAGGDPSAFSNISATGLKKKYDDIETKIKQKKKH